MNTKQSRFIIIIINYMNTALPTNPAIHCSERSHQSTDALKIMLQVKKVRHIHQSIPPAPMFPSGQIRRKAFRPAECRL